MIRPLSSYASVRSHEIVLGPSELEPELRERARLTTYDFATPTALLESSQNELAVAHQRGIPTFNPSFEEHIADFPETMQLARHMGRYLLGPLGTELSFIRHNPEQQGVFIGNLHHDIKYVGFDETTGRAGSFERVSRSAEVWRQAINLGPHSRYLQIVDLPLSHFTQQSIDTDTIRPDGRLVPGSGAIDEVNEHLIAPPVLEGKSQLFPIPAYDGETLHVFEFWASRILHAGITGKEGHFMAAAAKWQEPSLPSSPNGH